MSPQQMRKCSFSLNKASSDKFMLNCAIFQVVYIQIIVLGLNEQMVVSCYPQAIMDTISFEVYDRNFCRFCFVTDIA